ncbi:MAG TPA: glycosyltransferase family 39 protein [Verrucomicrobiae bacterium]
MSVFRVINLDWANPVFDAVMPFFSGNVFFVPVVVLLALLLIWKGGRRGLICVLMMALVVAIGDGFICNTLKAAVGRVRPCLALEDARCLLGRSGSGSFPSSHAANWFSGAMVALIYYRRSAWFMLPLAGLVGFSRVYNGVHYPSDILGGAVIGAGYAAAVVWLVDSFWLGVGRRWFPLWWARLPSLMNPPAMTRPADEEEPAEAVPLPRTKGIAPVGFQAPHVTLDDHWLRLGYVWLAILLVARLVYIASGTIQLAEDEAYQWVWSKHLALSYFSKPPLIAYTQFLGTTLWGDTAFGVRFFSPVISAIIGAALLRFFAREINARAGFFLLLILSATPLMAVGSVLMTIDPLSVLFWTLGMLAGWRAAQDRGTTRDWVWVGVWLGLGFLSKYTALFQLLCWAVFFVLWPPSRKHLRRPGPYLALLVAGVLSLPVLIWNAQHGWVTVAHLSDISGSTRPWRPTLKYAGEFLGAELGLLNPVFFVATAWAAIAMWRRFRNQPKMVYLFSMGAPLFLAYFAYSFRSRLLPNWIAPSVVPLFCLMVAYWDARWRLGQDGGAALRRRALIGGLAIGFAMVIVGHDTDLVRPLLGKYLPVNRDPLHRVREWDETARVANEARRELLNEGKPVFIIADHYGMTGQISFNLPEARQAVSGTPLVYCRSSEAPENQFYFWPGYDRRKGENAIYVRELDRDDPEPGPIPPRLQAEFDSVTQIGVSNVMYHGYLLRPLQLFACRGLK